MAGGLQAQAMAAAAGGGGDAALVGSMSAGVQDAATGEGEAGGGSIPLDNAGGDGTGQVALVGLMSGLPEPANDAPHALSLSAADEAAHGSVSGQFLTDSGRASSPQDTSHVVDRRLAGGLAPGSQILPGDDSTYSRSTAPLHPEVAEDDDHDAMLGDCKPMLKGAAFVTLCIIDLCHVFLTMLNMGFLAYMKEGDMEERELVNLQENAGLCLLLYGIKIISHGGLVVIRMLCNGHAQPSDATSRWRESQGWFVAMTFNSFMMLFPVFFVPTDGLGNPWRLVERSDYTKCTVNKKFKPPLGRQASTASESGRPSPLLSAEEISIGETVYITETQRRKAFPPPEEGGQAELDIRARATTITGFVLSKTQAHRQLVPRITAEGKFPGTKKGWMKVDGIPAGPGAGGNCLAITDDCVWKLSTHGWLDVFARLGQGGPWDLAASYAMLVNIICTFYAGLVNIKAITSHAQNDLLSKASLVAISIHFVVALWLYMGSKLYLTQSRQLGQTIVLVLIGVVDAASVITGLLLVHSLSSPTSQTLWHPPIIYKECMEECTDEHIDCTADCSKIPGRMQNVAFVWFMMICTMLAMQLSTAVLRGWELKQEQDRGRQAKKRETTNVDFTTVSDAFQAATFNTWLMPLVLVCLEVPYRLNLLTTDHDNSPFGLARTRLYHQTTVRKSAVVIYSLCRCGCTWMLIYVSVAYTAAPWGALTSFSEDKPPTLSPISVRDPFAGMCGTFPCDPKSIYATVALFALQGAVAFFFSFLWTQRPREWAAHLGMLLVCMLDMVNVTTSGYYAVCIAIGNSTDIGSIFECESDFFDGDDHPAQGVIQSISENAVFRRLAIAVLAIYAGRFIIQACAFALRRGCDNDAVDTVPLQSALVNGAVHGSFLLCALWPMDLPALLQNRWSPLQAQPHWTNGVVQLINLIEKTIMGYLMLQLHTPSAMDQAKPLVIVLISAFVSHSAIQLGAFVYQHLMRPGRADNLEKGDHVRMSAPSFCAVCSFCSKQTLEVKDIITVDEARRIIDQFEVECARIDARLAEMRAPDQGPLLCEREDLVNNLRLAKMLIPNDGEDPEPELCVFTLDQYITREADRHTQVQDQDSGRRRSRLRHSEIVSTNDAILSCADGSLPSVAIRGHHPDNRANRAKELRRVNSYGWSMTVMSLAFLDWFHVVFNLVNLSFMFGQFTDFHDDVMAQSERTRNSWLCIFCIGIYLVRVVVQPILLLWNGRRAFTTTTTFSEVWHADLRWYTTMSFNTLMMLPAMMFVNSPFRDSGKSVRDAYIKIGAQGAKDYQAGLILLLMVLKKTINGYLIVSWLIANEARKAQNDQTSDETTEWAQFISMGLLSVHLIVTLYVMMVPKLAHSQDGSVRWGCFLLSVALVDWLCLLTNALSLIDVFHHGQDNTHEGDDITSTTGAELVGAMARDVSMAPCAWEKQNVIGVSVAAAVLFFVRVLAQVLAYFYLRRVRGPLNRKHLNLRDSVDMSEEGIKWRRWSNEFQALTFNSWMMIIALLFIEKPYRSNLLSSGEESPFRRKTDRAEGCDGLNLVGLIYAIMVFKKLLLIYVNVFKLRDDCFADGQKTYGNAVSTLALVFTALHSFLWFYSFRQMGVCDWNEDSDDDDVFERDASRELPNEELRASHQLDNVTEGSFEGTSSSGAAGSSADRSSRAMEPEPEPEPEPQSGGGGLEEALLGSE